MDVDYFKNVKPQALFRSWFTSEMERDTFNFDYGVQLKFYNEGEEVVGKTFGSFKNYVEKAQGDLKFLKKSRIFSNTF